MWMLKSVKPTMAGWYATWSEKYPNVAWPRYFSATMLGWLVYDQHDMKPNDDFDMWCPLPVPPDVHAFHQVRAFLNAKMN